MDKRRITTMMIILTLLVLAQLACEDTPTTMPLPGDQGAYAAAQATLDSGQRQAMELSYQATVISLNMYQAANAAAQTTMDYNQRQLMELSIQGTQVSQNMARAAATQQFTAKQTQMAWNTISTAQSEAATATYSVYLQRLSQIAQAQAILNLQATQTAQTNATLTAYPLTATPWAAIQADILRKRNEAERRALWDEFVVTPLKVILLTLVVLLLIVGGVMAYRQLIPALEIRLRTISRDNDSPLLLVDGMFVDPDPSHQRLTQQELRLLEHSRLPSDETPNVEIIGPSEPSISNWITEAEQKLRSDGWIFP
jgi:hypothetical protein